jgi:hypothetical protein
MNTTLTPDAWSLVAAYGSPFFEVSVVGAFGQSLLPDYPHVHSSIVSAHRRARALADQHGTTAHVIHYDHRGFMRSRGVVKPKGGTA